MMAPGLTHIVVRTERSRQTHHRRVISLCAATVVAVAAGCGGTGSDKAGGAGPPERATLTLAAYAQPDPDDYVAAVSRLSQGAIRVQAKVLWRDGQRDYEQATIADVRRGDVDLALVGARAFDLVGVTSFQGLLAPFLIDNLALQRRVLESDLPGEMLGAVDRLGLVGLGIFPGPLRRPVGLRRPLTHLEDYRGAIVGTRPSALNEKTFRALGATTKAVLLPGDFPSIVGAEYDATGLDFSRYDGPAKSIAANVVYWPKPLVLIANRGMFERLTAPQRAVLRRAASEALAPALEHVQGNETAAVRAMCLRADLDLVTASPAELARLRAAVEPVYVELRRDAFSRRVVEEIESLRVAPRPETLRCDGRAAVRPGPRATVLDGTWEWTVTRDELLAAGDNPSGAGRNAGRWRLVLDRGRFTLRNLDSGDTYRGTSRIKGNRLVSRVMGDQVAVAYTWSLYREELKLRPVDPTAYAAIVVAKPLRRVG
jgi:TRAP-type C4-dicarboxylate transport system substrate-binding protein